MSEPAVAIEGVSKRFGRTLALDNVGFEVRRNELFALLGPNGAGKTTLGHILCTILRPDSGSARINGIDVVENPLAGRRSLGVVFQEPSLDDRLTLYENLNFHGLIYGVPAAQRRSRIEAMLELVELSEWRAHMVRTLSSGMKRRLEIARAFVHDAQNFCFSMNRPSAWMRNRVTGCGATFAGCVRSVSSPSSSPPITSRRWTAPTASASSTGGTFWPTMRRRH